MSAFIIMFREAFEAVLIIGIILSYLHRTHQHKYKRTVYLGIIVAITVSIATAFIVTYIAGEFTGRSEEVFEGVSMWITVVFLTYMILWCIQHKHKVSEIEKQVSTEILNGYRWGIFALVFIGVLREGVESVLFLRGIVEAYDTKVLWFSILGVLTAIALGYMLFKGLIKFSLKTFFNITSFILILFAAGLLAHGTHELQEAKLIPTIIENVYNINPASSSHPLHEKGYIGSVLVSLFGYNGNPSLIEVLSYLTYLLVAFGWWRNIERKHELSRLANSDIT